MKKLIMTVLLSILLLVTFLVSGCGVILVQKNGETELGETETRQYDFTEFTHVDIGSAFEYEIQQADTYSISITADSNLFDDIRVTKVGQTLDIGIEFPGVTVTIWNVAPRFQAVITMPQFQGLDSSGATHGTVTGFRSEQNLDVTVSGASTVELEDIAAGDTAFDISGASEITGHIVVKDLELEVSGASTVQLKGSANSLATDGSGASHLKLADLKVGNAEVILSGASDATINLTGRLDADLSGASKLEYIGEPTLGIMDATGASIVKKK
ncbi:GIN domain-containing protein [Chloroflexota bacterium]